MRCERRRWAGRANKGGQGARTKAVGRAREQRQWAGRASKGSGQGARAKAAGRAGAKAAGTDLGVIRSGKLQLMHLNPALQLRSPHPRSRPLPHPHPRPLPPPRPRPRPRPLPLPRPRPRPLGLRRTLHGDEVLERELVARDRVLSILRNVLFNEPPLKDVAALRRQRRLLRGLPRHCISPHRACACTPVNPNPALQPSAPRRPTRNQENSTRRAQRLRTRLLRS